MQRMDTSLMRLLDSEIITPEEAYFKSRNKAEFEPYLDGREVVENQPDPDVPESVSIN